MSTYHEIKYLHALKKKHAEVDAEVEKHWDKMIDAETKRRKVKNSIAEDPYDYGKGRPMGSQDIGDISYKEPWQKIVRDQLGISIPINTDYTCPVCGKKWMLDMPPERCTCGTRCFLNLKKLVNLKV